jgi:hypothetical protein
MIVYTDEVDGEKYYVKKKDDKFVLCDADGYTLDITPDGYFSTRAGTLVEVNEETGSCKTIAIVDTDDENEIYSTSIGRFQMFEYVPTDSIQELVIGNDSGQFTFYRDADNKVRIKKYEDFPISQVFFEYLASSCGYSLTRYKVTDPIKDENGEYTEYGLAEQIRKDEDGNEYTHKPMWYRITDASSKVYTVYVGDMAPDGSGYYAKFASRDSVYIMSYELSENDAGLAAMYEDSFESIDPISNLIACPVERFIAPALTMPMDTNNYVLVDNFSIFDGDSLTDGTPDGTAKPLISFSYWDTEDRFGTLYSNYAYKLIHPAGYSVSDAAVGNALSALYTMKFVRVVELNVGDDAEDKYGLADPEYLIYFNFSDTDHYIFVSKLTENGTYYVMSSLYDMVLEVNRARLLFLEYDLIDWIAEEYFEYNIAWVEKITLENENGKYVFELDNSETDSITNPNCSEAAKKEKAVESDRMKVYAYDHLGNKMYGLTQYTVTDKEGYVWTINEKSVSVKDKNGKSVEIVNDGYYDTNALGQKVVVLLGQIEGKDGTTVSVSANNIVITEPSGASKVYLRYGMDMFRRFYSSILHATVEGSVREGDFALSDERIDELLSDIDGNCSMKLTIETSYKDTDFVYRFYPYSERRAMITVNGGAGEFYVLRGFNDKIAADAVRVIEGKAVDSTSKY